MTLIDEYYGDSYPTSPDQGRRWPRDLAMGAAGAVGALVVVGVVWATSDNEPDTVAPHSPSYSCAQYPLEEECTHPAQ